MAQTYRHKILKFLKTQKLAVIATSDSSRPTPESALIAFTEDDDLCLYFQTGKHTRKATNLRQNPHTSLVIGLGLNDMVTVQYEGVAQQLVDEVELADCKRRFVTKDSPANEHYFNHPTTIFFKIRPSWIGYSDYSGVRPEVIELKTF